MKILFIGNSRLGDAILSTPILNFYNTSNNYITVICSSLSKSIYASFSSVTKVIILNKKKRGLHWIEAYNLLEATRWDLVVDLRNSLLSRIIRKKSIIRYAGQNNKIHKVENNSNLISLKKNKTPYIPASKLNNNIISKLIKKEMLYPY